MSHRNARVLRRELDRFSRRRGKCIPDELKQRVSTWLVEQRRQGASVSELASELGLAYGTALRWSNDVARAIVPVRVVPERESARTVRVVGPSGFCVEGLTLDDAAKLLRTLE